ncbi:hypothetical protein LTR27_011999 [Elasticomyces elasticus]|nr:hypothetical protein LTR27_011999 [Elasticomyces elasticus]
MVDTSKVAATSLLNTIKDWLSAIEAGISWVGDFPGRVWTAICDLFIWVLDALLAFVLIVGKGIGIALAIYWALVAIVWAAGLVGGCVKRREARLPYAHDAREREGQNADEAQELHHQQQPAHETVREDQRRQRRVQEEAHSRRQAERARTEESQRQHDLRFQGAATQERRTNVRRRYDVWRAECEQAFSPSADTNYTPEPPNWLCDNKECITTSRVLRACKHNLQELFTSTEDQSTLRGDLRLWHPNNSIFAKMENDGNTRAIAYATEIAAVISGLVPTRST